MSRPQIIVTVTGALPRRGLPTETGTAFLLYAGATGPTTPTVCLSAAAATLAGAPDPIAAWVADTLEQGAPEVVLLRAAAFDAAAVTQPEWTTALGKLTKDLGPGQVCIPGVSTDAAYAALLAHAAAFGNRVVCLDGPSTVVPATLVTKATGLRAAQGAIRAGVVAGWVPVPAVGGTTRTIPGSLVAAGLAARGDAVVGHTNHAPIFDQGRNAGAVRRGTGVTTTFTDAETDTLYDAGVNAIRMIDGRPTLAGWRALTDDPIFRQLNVGRLTMQLANGMTGLMGQFLGVQIDGRGQLFAKVTGAIRGYLLPLWSAAALYGETADDAFAVQCDKANNTTATIQAGELHADVELAATAHTEKIIMTVVTAVAEGVAA